jgi:hypothetical protein
VILGNCTTALAVVPELKREMVVVGSCHMMRSTRQQKLGLYPVSRLDQPLGSCARIATQQALAHPIDALQSIDRLLLLLLLLVGA